MPTVRIVSFMTIFLGVLFVSHLVFYYSFTRFFGITSPAKRYLVIVVLLFLSLSFILASYLAHLQENILTRAFYFGAGFWLGLLLNLLMASVAGWLIIWTAGAAGYIPGRALIGGVLFAAAFIYSVYGVWNASNPRVKDVNVSIRNLPEQWKGRTIVQLSDVHLGHVYKAGFLEKVVRKVNSLHPDMVVITGDLFDGMDGTLFDMVAPINELKPPLGTYFITGNHENYLGVDKAYASIGATGVISLKDEVRDLDGLQLIGLSYPQRGLRKDVYGTIESLPGFVQGKPTILLYHPPVEIEHAKAAGVNLQLSGHTHRGQVFPVCFITDYIYKGMSYGLHTLGDYNIYTTDGVGTWGPPMRTGNTPEIVDIKLN